MKPCPRFATRRSGLVTLDCRLSSRIRSRYGSASITILCNRLQSIPASGGVISMKTVAIFLVLGALGWAVPVNAQTAGATLLVEARDAAGAALPGVLVTVTSQETGLERAGVTVDDGTIWLVRLPAGTYNLTAVRGGFKT